MKLSSWFCNFNDIAQLGIESQAVIARRCAIVATGGPAASLELQRMVMEKLAVFGETSAMLLGGAPPKKVMRRYRRHVRSNNRRLKAGSR